MTEEAKPQSTLARVGGSNEGHKIASSAEADRALGKSRKDTVEAVDKARAELAAKKASQLPTSSAPVEGAYPPPPAPPEPATSEPTVEAPSTAEASPSKPEESETRRREARLVEGQKRLAREREEFAAYRRRVEGELAAARDMSRAAKADPVGWLGKEFGIRPEALASLAARPSAERAAPPVAVLPPEVTQELQAFRQERELFRRQQEEGARERELEKFAADARGGASKWPLASRYSAEKLKARGWDIALTSARQGVTLSNEEVLDRIEEELSEIAALGKPASKTSSTAAAPAAPDRPAATQTLTSRGDSEPGPPTSSPIKLSRKEMIARTVASVEEAMKARRAANRV